MSVIIFKANRLYPYSMNMLMWSLHSRLRWLTNLEIKLPPGQWEILIEKKIPIFHTLCGRVEEKAPL